MKTFTDRNSFASLKDEPVTEEMIDNLEIYLNHYWEDTMVVTKPNREYIGITIGNLRALAHVARNGIQAEKRMSRKIRKVITAHE